MSAIVITRHGKYLRRGNDGHLTKKGIRGITDSARILKTYFEEAGINPSYSRVFHSHLIRSKETARIFQETLGAKILIEEPRIADYRSDLDIHFAMVKSPICNPKRLATGQVYMLMRQPEGFETYEDVAQRFSGFLNELICALQDEEGVVVITHAPVPDYLLLNIFSTGLCKGDGLRHGELLKIQKEGKELTIKFRDEQKQISARKIAFNRALFQRKKRHLRLCLSC